MAAEYDITIVQGESFRLPLVWKDAAGDPINLTGYSARMQIRKNAKAAAILHEMTSTTPSGITLGTTGGEITLTIPPATSSAFTFRSGVYDLELVSADTTVTRLMRGRVTVDPEVTR